MCVLKAASETGGFTILVDSIFSVKASSVCKSAALSSSLSAIVFRCRLTPSEVTSSANRSVDAVELPCLRLAAPPPALPTTTFLSDDSALTTEALGRAAIAFDFAFGLGTTA